MAQLVGPVNPVHSCAAAWRLMLLTATTSRSEPEVCGGRQAGQRRAAQTAAAWTSTTFKMGTFHLSAGSVRLLRKGEFDGSVTRKIYNW